MTGRELNGLESNNNDSRKWIFSKIRKAILPVFQKC